MFTCVCEDYDYDTEFYCARVVTARKEHKCCECSDVIVPGEKYEYVSGKSDGDLFTAKTCLVCSKIRDSIFQCGFYHGDLWRWVHDEICEDGTDVFCVCPDNRRKR